MLVDNPAQPSRRGLRRASRIAASLRAGDLSQQPTDAKGLAGKKD